VRKLVVALIVLGVLAMAADRVAARWVGQEVERRLVAEGFSEPDVQMHGFPFLPQLAARDFDRVSLTSKRVQGAEGSAEDVGAVLTNVRVPTTGPVEIGSLAASGTVPYQVVVDAVGAPSLRLAPGPRGQVKISQAIELFRETFEVVASARIRADGRTLRLVPTGLRLRGGGSLDDRLTALLADRVQITYRIPDLPDGVRLERVSAGRDGFRVRVSGRDLAVARS
jgi:LmeA-like phospholipid-binding